MHFFLARKLSGFRFVHCIRLSPSGSLVFRVLIQASSVRKRRLMSDVVWVITVTRKLFDAWLSAVKWRDTGFNWLFALMSARCPLMRSLTVFPVCPTYCMLHALHVRR